MVYDVLVIGGGAAGMMATAISAETGAHSHSAFRIALIERNKQLGRKVAISGGGRCNVTTGLEEVKQILRRYPRGAKFLQYAMHELSPQKVREWFAEHGLQTKVEDDLRVFPVSDHGEDVIAVFEKIFKEQNVEILYGATVSSVEKKDDEFVVKLSDGRTLEAKKIVLASGGQAYRHTGSQGDSYSFAQNLGHTITPLAPSLNAFVLSESWVKSCAGISFEQVKLSAPAHKDYNYTGPLVFTHRGISGPSVFALSSLTAFESHTTEKPMNIQMDFFPQENDEAFTARVVQLLNKNPRKQMSSILDMLLPKSFVQIIAEIAHIPLQLDAAQLSKKQLQAIVQSLKHLEVHAVGHLPGEEFVTAGGVSTDEVDPKTMQSKICPGLYFAGEILNIDGYTGGFNLQAAWATGYIAGKALQH